MVSNKLVGRKIQIILFYLFYSIQFITLFYSMKLVTKAKTTDDDVGGRGVHKIHMFTLMGVFALVTVICGTCKIYYNVC